jgi:hypothetical protein
MAALAVGRGTRPHDFVLATNITILAVQHRIPFMMSAPQNKEEGLRSKRRRPRWSASASIDLILLAFSIMSSVAAGQALNLRQKSTFNVRQFQFFDDAIPNDFDDDGNNLFKPPTSASEVLPLTTTAPAPTDINYRASPSQALSILDLPTDSPKPSPSPSHAPSRSPTLSVPTVRPTLGPSDTQRPSPSPSASPTVTATRSPTVAPSPFPVAPPTPLPTQVPTEMPTPFPIAPPPPSPLPTPAPIEVWTPQPTLPITNPPSPGPVATLVPSFVPTVHPTTSPTLTTVAPMITPAPTVATMDPTFEVPSRAPPLQFPTSKPSGGPWLILGVPSSAPSLSTTTTPSLAPIAVPIEQIPMPPFGLTLTFAAPLSLDEFNTLSTELEVAVADYLFRELNGTDFGQGVALTGFNVNVSLPTLSSSAPNANRRLRSLQSSQALPFVVDGRAAFDASDQSTVNTAALANQVDESVTQVLESPESQAQFEDYLKSSETEVLSQTAGATVETQNRDVSGSKGPSIAAIAGGFTLVGIGALGLIGYSFVWCKGRRKRAAQRKRDREGISATPNKNASPPRRAPQSNNSPILPIVMPVMTQATRQDDESSEGSSYEGVDSESEASDLFAKELRLAASLDRRAWDDYQQQRGSVERDSLTKNARDAGAFPSAGVAGVALGIGLYAARSQDEDEGMEIVDAESHSQLIIRPTSDTDDFEPYGDSAARELAASSPYLYGDESPSARLSPSRQDPPAPRGSTKLLEPRHIEPAGHRGSYFRAYETEQGVEWASPTRISTVVEQTESTEDWSTINGIDESRPYGHAAYGERRWSSMDNIGVESVDEALALMGALTAGTAMAPTFRNFDSSGKASPLSFEEDPVQDAAMATRDLENLRASPNSSFTGSAPSSQAVLLSPQTTGRSPNTSAPTAQQSQNRGIGDESTEDKHQSKGSSLLTIDIVKEVEKLSRFVRRYERKREKQKGKEHETLDQNVVAESRSMGYDAFSDSVSAMKAIPATEQNVSGDSLSYLRGTYALTNLDLTPVENEPSETDESSENSFSTHSEVDTPFYVTDGEDEPLLQEKDKGNGVGVPAQFEGVNYGESEDEDESADLSQEISENISEDSRLGITPFNVQQLMAEHNRQMDSFPVLTTEESVSRPEQPKSLHVSRPPVTGNPFSSTILSPIPGTPATPEDNTPRSRFTPSSDLNRKILADLAMSTPAADSNHHIFTDESESPPLKRRKSPGSPVDSNPVLKTLNYQASTPQFGRKSNELSASEKRLGDDHILWKEDNPQLPIAPLKTLSQLRMRDAILDEAESEIISNLGMSEDPASPLASSPLAASPPSDSRSLPSPNGALVSPFKPSPRKSRNKGFSSLLSMFENKPKEAIFPPNENWQYNSGMGKRK